MKGRHARRGPVSNAVGRVRGGRGSPTVGGVVIGGDYQGLGIVRSLGRHGIPAVVVDDERSIARASRFTRGTVRVPDLHDDDAVVDALHLARRRFGLDGWVLYPTREEIVAALSRRRRELSTAFRVPTPEWACVRTAWDKRETYRTAEANDVATPKTWYPRDESDLDKVDLSVPVVLKPAVKERFFYRTGAKAWRADTTAELHRLFTRATSVIAPEEVIVQEMVPGDGQQQYAYCAFFRAGGPVASMTVRRRRQHPSDFGRASTYVETVEAPELEAPSVRFLRAIDYYGLVELEYKRDPRDGRVKLLDVNPRTWGYHSAGYPAGVDFPYLLFRDQTGGHVGRTATVRARSGVRWIRLATDVPNAVVDIAAGRLSLRAYLASLRGIHTEAVFSWRDPLPGLYEVALLPYLALRRGL